MRVCKRRGRVRRGRGLGLGGDERGGCAGEGRRVRGPAGPGHGALDGCARRGRVGAARARGEVDAVAV